MNTPLSTRTARALLAGLLALSIATPRTARAEASSDDPQNKLATSPHPPATPPTSWKHDGTWGWFLAASSIFVGGGVSGVGLAVSCTNSHDQKGCEQRASMLIWGGIGLGALGSVIGLAVAAAGRDRTHLPAPAALDFKPASHVCKVESAGSP